MYANMPQVRLLPRHVPGLPERFDASQLLLAALNKFVFLRVRTGPPCNPAPAGLMCPRLRSIQDASADSVVWAS